MPIGTIPEKANADHLVACWNAIEEHCGGDPAIVEELKLKLAVLVLFDETQEHGSARIEYQLAALVSELSL